MPHERLGYRREAARCVCVPGGVAHDQHCRPGKMTGAHFDPRCPHSELANTTGRYEDRRLTLEARRLAALARTVAQRTERTWLIR